MKKVGIIGLGVMGYNCAEKLHQAGIPVCGFDCSSSALQRCSCAGMDTRESLQTLGCDCDVVILFLPGPAEVKSVVLGPEGLAQSLKPGAIIVNMSTVDPGVNVYVGDELADKGIKVVDAPVLGSPSGVGSWGFALGGDKEVVASLTPILLPLAGSEEKLFYLGQLGNGNKLKLLNNMMLGAINACAAEILALAEHMGLSRKALIDVAVAGKARTLSSCYEEVANRSVEERYDSPTFTVDMLKKDVHLCLEMAKEYNAPIILGAAVDYLNRMASAQKMGHLDHSVMWKAVSKTWK